MTNHLEPTPCGVCGKKPSYTWYTATFECACGNEIITDPTKKQIVYERRQLAVKHWNKKQEEIV